MRQEIRGEVTSQGGEEVLAKRYRIDGRKVRGIGGG